MWAIELSRRTTAKKEQAWMGKMMANGLAKGLGDLIAEVEKGEIIAAKTPKAGDRMPRNLTRD